MNAIATPLEQQPDPGTGADEMIVALASCDSPLGRLHVASVTAGVCGVACDERRDALERRLRRTFGPFFRVETGDPLGVRRRLDDYFGGDLRALRGVPLATAATPLQRHVWALVRALPEGATTTYSAIAARLGMPRAQRAVGVCLASNPVPLLVPCHRVVAASGSLGGHPGGVARKRWLLRHEGALAVADLTAARALRTRRRAPADAQETCDAVDLVVPRVAGW
jgi:methylated-DNA-[protein]-cysteine S-methyltransferase